MSCHGPSYPAPSSRLVWMGGSAHCLLPLLSVRVAISFASPVLSHLFVPSFRILPSCSVSLSSHHIPPRQVVTSGCVALPIARSHPCPDGWLYAFPVPAAPLPSFSPINLSHYVSFRRFPSTFLFLIKKGSTQWKCLQQSDI